MATKYKPTVDDLFTLPPGPEKTFSNDSNLPKLPVPSLKHTLERYVESLEPFVSSEELTNSKRLVHEFEHGIGKELHQKLLQKAANERNWVEKWWDDLAYLSVRQPLIPFCSMTGMGLDGALETLPFPDDQIKVLSVYLYHSMNMWLLVRKERLRPAQGKNNVYFSMNQFRHLHNTVRVPGEQIDSLVSYFKTEREGACPDHMVVLCNGRLFRVSGLNETGSALCPEDWEVQLRTIESLCKKNEGPGIGVLTCDERARWAKNRKHLQNVSPLNREALHSIESAIAIVVLDKEEALTQSDVALRALSGDFSNRWADKSTAIHCYKNGTIGGLCDHTAFDGSISCHAMYYNYLAIQEPLPPLQRAKSLTPPTEIQFQIDQVLNGEIQLAKARLEGNKSLLLFVYEEFAAFGKLKMQAHRIHPDSFVQMALQLAYYRMHHKIAPTYETATTRGYYNGRTETVRSCTTEAVRWVKVMVDPHSSVAEKRRLLQTALKKQDSLMNEAKKGEGCDRHLFGLYCLAAEQGIPIPSLFSDPAYAKSGGGGNFVLSTSLLGYTPILGGVAPMCPDGYGVFYNMCSTSLHFAISAWREGPESSACKFFKSVSQSLVDIMELLGPLPAKL